jgi:type II secretory pathway pseudopilin PulG
MAARRIPLGLLAPVSLVILVVALGALQYRWVGQVSEADRAQLKQSLDRRAREFAEDFDRQIGRAYDVFRLPASFSTSSPDVFAKKFDDWQATAAFAGLIPERVLRQQRRSRLHAESFRSADADVCRCRMAEGAATRAQPSPSQPAPHRGNKCRQVGHVHAFNVPGSSRRAGDS